MQNHTLNSYNFKIYLDHQILTSPSFSVPMLNSIHLKLKKGCWVKQSYTIKNEINTLTIILE